MPMMTPQVFKSVDFTKTEKSRYLENETFFLQIKKSINYTSTATLWQKYSFEEEVTFDPKKSGALSVYTTFPQITQIHKITNKRQIITTDTYNWLLARIPVTLNIPTIFSLGKTTPQFFDISENLQESQRKTFIPGTFWYFKSKLQIINVTNFFQSLVVVPLLSIRFPYVSTRFFLFFFVFVLFLFLFSPSFSYFACQEVYSTISNDWFNLFTTNIKIFHKSFH